MSIGIIDALKQVNVTDTKAKAGIILPRPFDKCLKILHCLASVVQTGKLICVCLPFQLIVVFDQLSFQLLTVSAADIEYRRQTPEDRHGVHDLDYIFLPGGKYKDRSAIPELKIEQDTQRTEHCGIEHLEPVMIVACKEPNDKHYHKEMLYPDIPAEII
jgi:hypothetical protein